MRIFLTGASGLVGGAFARAAASRGHEIIGTVGQFAGEIPGLQRQLTLDLTNEGAVTNAILDAFPQAIVNCAAVSEPAQVDAEPARSQSLNVALPALLARLAHHVSARLLHLSSEQAFDGERSTPYSASEPPSPINLYGHQKIESERIVHATAGEWAVTVRAPLLMGNSPGGRRSTHERLFLDWAAGRPAKLYTDEFRQTCTAENLAEAMVELCERPELRGVYHWAGTELLSRYDIGVLIREHFRLPPNQAPITPVDRVENAAAAKNRQACLALDIGPLATGLQTRPESFAEQLARLAVPPPTRVWYESIVSIRDRTG